MKRLNNIYKILNPYLELSKISSHLDSSMRYLLTYYITISYEKEKRSIHQVPERTNRKDATETP